MKAFIHKTEKGYCIATEGKGGAVVMGETLEEAKAKYYEAYYLSTAAENMLAVNNALKSGASFEEAKAKWKLSEPIEYVEI